MRERRWTILFPKDAAANGADGLLFTWDEEKSLFAEDPMTKESDNCVTDTICYINDETGRPVEMRTRTCFGEICHDCGNTRPIHQYSQPSI